MIVDKGWGKETVFATNELYAGKFLEFAKSGSRTSMQFHKDKDKTLVVIEGAFKLTLIKTENASYEETILRKGDVFRISPLLPHQLESLEENSTIIEVSTADNVYDTYRVIPGDSQL